jgi:putative addiction module component (TIGR02574 family)
MSKSANEVLAEALALPADARVMLAESLLESLDEPAEVVAEAWRVEAHRRLAEIENGEVEPVSWEEVRAGMRARLSK